jgi:hypothetical protein
LGKETYCRTVKFDGNEYEEIPAKAIRQAVFRVLGLEEAKTMQEADIIPLIPDRNCNCNGGCC